MKLTEEFKYCYKYFNVYNVTEQIEKLSKKEKYLLLISATDFHDENQPITLSNFIPFEKELIEIGDYFDSKSGNETLEEIKNETGKSEISTDDLDLPKVLTIQEAREHKLNNMFDNTK